MKELIFRTLRTDPNDGTIHLFEVYKSNIPGSMPYQVHMDYSFYCTAESRREAWDEIEAITDSKGLKIAW